MILSRFLSRHVVLAAGLTTAALAVAGVPATAGAATPVAPLVAAQNTTAVAGEYIVVLKPGTARAKAAASVRLAQAAGGTVRQQFSHALSGYAAKLAADDLARVRQDPTVAYVEAVQASQAVRSRNAGSSAAGSAAQPASGAMRPQIRQSPASWNLDRIDQRPVKLDNVFGFGASGQRVTAYLVGTGGKRNHPDYKPHMAAGVNLSGDGRGIEDCYGDDTMAADLLGGASWGVAKNVRLVPVKVVPCAAPGVDNTATFVAAMDWIIADHAADKAAVANIDDWYAGSDAVDAAVAASTPASRSACARWSDPYRPCSSPATAAKTIVASLRRVAITRASSSTAATPDASSSAPGASLVATTVDRRMLRRARSRRSRHHLSLAGRR